jgi:hypothetical protein
MVNRIEPQLPAHLMTTYSVRSPISTHFRAATCAEVECPNLEHGWRSVVDERTDLGQAQAYYIRHDSGRRFREEYQPDGLTSFTFEAGQQCFGKHQVRTARPEMYLVHGGDWRGNPRQDVRQHTSADDWIDDFAEHQQTLADRLAQG